MPAPALPDAYTGATESSDLTVSPHLLRAHFNTPDVLVEYLMAWEPLDIANGSQHYCRGAPAKVCLRATGAPAASYWQAPVSGTAGPGRWYVISQNIVYSLTQDIACMISHGFAVCHRILGRWTPTKRIFKTYFRSSGVPSSTLIRPNSTP